MDHNGLGCRVGPGNEVQIPNVQFRTMLALLATVYGVGSSFAALLQARQLLARRRSCEISAALFGIYLGGYGLWLAYGPSVGSLPLVVVNAAGVLAMAAVLGVALSLRGSLWQPRSWSSCPVCPRFAPARRPEFRP